MSGRVSNRAFGRAMAQLHLAAPLAAEAQEGKFGFAVDNTIGATPQPNPWTADWVEFFREHRIGHQVRGRSGWIRRTKGAHRFEASSDPCNLEWACSFFEAYQNECAAFCRVRSR